MIATLRCACGALPVAVSSTWWKCTAGHRHTIAAPAAPPQAASPEPARPTRAERRRLQRELAREQKRLGKLLDLRTQLRRAVIGMRGGD